MIFYQQGSIDKEFTSEELKAAMFDLTEKDEASSQIDNEAELPKQEE